MTHWQRLLLWIDKRRVGWHLVEATQGRFYVRYLDGAKSHKFFYSTAKDYAELFGGAVVHAASGQVVYEAVRAFPNPGNARAQ
ncbi:hypothetical protein ACK8QS_22860 (plasmid) [Ectopseudomonas mendocina]